MRTVSQIWGAINASQFREPRYYFRIQPNLGTASDDLYIVSHGDITITSPGTVVTAARLEDVKVSSQQLNPDEGRATIGSMSFSVLDVDASMTARQRLELLTNDRGLRGKRCSLYSGFRQLADSNYELEDTQVVESVEYRSGLYTFRCRDIQREMRREIFEPVVMHLAQPLDADSTTVEVFTTNGLEAVEHGTSYSDAASQTVAYVRIDDEIIRVPEAGILPTQLTGVTRGVLGTRAAEHTTDESKGSERGKKVTEVIYLEMPVPKMAYALLSGVLFGQVGTLPDHWHLGMDASDDIRASDFQNIGDDLFVMSDDTEGVVERYILDSATDGKTFIERQMLRKYGMFMPVHSNGELGLKRGQPVLSGSATVGEINDRHIIDEVSIRYDMTKVVNDIEIAWNEINGEPSRFLNIVDQNSVDIWGTAPKLTVAAKGLVGSIHTDSRVRDLYEGLRDRYSGPPIITKVRCQKSQNLYEVGDVIRLRSSHVRDFTSALAGTLDRAFEVQGVNKDLMNGTVTYDLFGSTQRAGPLPPLEAQTALADSFYTASGTNIASLAGVVDAGSELQLPDGLTLTGASTVSAAVYYATKDVRVMPGTTVHYTQNVQLRIRGTLQVDGDLSGEGAGLAGVADTVATAGIPEFGDSSGPVSFATQAGTPGYFGSTQADGGIIERTRRRSGSTSRYRVRIQSLPATITQGRVEAIPSLNLVYNGTSIQGIPSDLRGTSGGPGGLRYWHESRDNNTDVNRGGTGGAGGAGLLVISRGFTFGASGRIVSSGADGTIGVTNLADERPAWSGSGAGGAPGATIILLDGATAPSPVITNGTIIADYGDSPRPSESLYSALPDTWVEYRDTRIANSAINRAMVPPNRFNDIDLSSSGGREAGIAAARFFFLLPEVTPEEDLDDVDLAAAQDIDLVVTEAFEAREDPSVTLLLATITEVDTTAAYSHANIYIRGTSAGAQYRQWHFVGPAEPTLQFEVPADGETYSIRAVPVLINGIEAPQGTEYEQVLSPPGVLVEVSASASLNWVQSPGGGAWSPSTTTVDVTYTFRREGTEIAQHVVRVTRSGASLTAATQGTPTGEATTFSILSGDGTGQLTLQVAHDDSGATRAQSAIAVQSGSNGTPGPQGPAGDDGAAGIAPFSRFRGQVGAFTNGTLTANQTGGGASDDGEIGITGSRWFFRDGTVYDTDGARTVFTPYESAAGRTAEVFYVILGQSTAVSRFGGNFPVNHNFFCAEYDAAADTWTAIANDNSEEIFSPLSTDAIVAIGSRVSAASSGIENLTQVGATMTLDADTAPLFIQAAAIEDALIGSLSAAKITAGNITVALNLTTGNLQVSNTGRMFSGKSSWAAAAAGWIFEVNGGAPRFKIGNADGSKEFGFDENGDLFYKGGRLENVDSVKVEPETYSSSAASPQTTSAGILLHGDGRLQSREGVGSPVFTDIGYWLGNGASRYYEVRMDVVSGSFDGTSDSTGTWLDWSSFSSNRQWVRTRSAVGTSTAVGDLSIRRTSDNEVILGPVRITLEATVV